MSEDETQRRIAENQAAFRSANEGIERSADAIGILESIPFLCECPVQSCTELVKLTLDEYEDVRREPTWFFAAPGHGERSTIAGAGRVVEHRDGYVLVEKTGPAAEVAEATYGDEA